jgi:hypothetical protein
MLVLEMGSFCQNEDAKSWAKRLRCLVGAKVADGRLAPRQRLAFISVEPRKLSVPLNQNFFQLGVPLQRLGMKHFIHSIDVDCCNRIAFYAIKKPVDETGLLHGPKRRIGAGIRLHACDRLPAERAHAIEVNLSLGNPACPLERLGLRIRGDDSERSPPPAARAQARSKSKWSIRAAMCFALGRDLPLRQRRAHGGRDDRAEEFDRA